MFTPGFLYAERREMKLANLHGRYTWSPSCIGNATIKTNTHTTLYRNALITLSVNSAPKQQQEAIENKPFQIQYFGKICKKRDSLENKFREQSIIKSKLF